MAIPLDRQSAVAGLAAAIGWASNAALFAISKPCDIQSMARPDLYDYAGMVLAALVVALWVAHFMLPAPPPDASRIDAGAAQPVPSIPAR
jgi:hypothetical protein